MILQLLAVLMLNARFAPAQQPVELAAITEPIQINKTSLPAPPTADEPFVVWAGFQLLAINNIDDKDEGASFLFF